MRNSIIFTFQKPVRNHYTKAVKFHMNKAMWLVSQFCWFFEVMKFLGLAKVLWSVRHTVIMHQGIGVKMTEYYQTWISFIWTEGNTIFVFGKGNEISAITQVPKEGETTVKKLTLNFILVEFWLNDRIFAGAHAHVWYSPGKSERLKFHFSLICNYTCFELPLLFCSW